MKNKKLLTRIFALLASLTLVVALALPCFADETDPLPTDYGYKRVYSYAELLASYNGGVVEGSCIFRDHFDTDNYNYGSIYLASDDRVLISFTLPTSSGIYFYTIEIYSDDTILFQYVYFEDGQEDDFFTETVTWNAIDLFILVPVPVDDNNIIEEQGWYGQIKNIIKDAVFGSDTVLNDSQEFTLNQISLWLSIIVLLLPLIVVAVIVARCFR